MEPVSSQNILENHISICSIYVGQVKANPLISESIWSVWSKLRALLEQKNPSAQPSEIKQALETLRNILPFTQLSAARRAAFHALEKAAASHFNFPPIPLRARDINIPGVCNTALSPLQAIEAIAKTIGNKTEVLDLLDESLPMSHL